MLDEAESIFFREACGFRQHPDMDMGTACTFSPGKYLRVKVDGGTLRQGEDVPAWNECVFFEVSLDAGVYTLSP